VSLLSRVAALPAALLLAACATPPTQESAKPRAPSRSELRPPEAFDTIRDPADRSRALFLESTRVMLHPRCANCHMSVVHDPPVARGPDDVGVPALRCDSCHQDKNLALARVPGAPGWHLAPRSMAWFGRSPAAICAQLKDPEKNGKRSLEAIVDHAAHDRLVAWAWDPGHERAPAPGTQARFGALVDAWVKTGAACPAEDAPTPTPAPANEAHP